MKVLEPGHTYLLDELDFVQDYSDHGTPIYERGERLYFVKRVGEKYPGNTPPQRSGTTTQEVLRALIDRTGYVDGQTDDLTSNSFNWQVLDHLRSSLMLLEQRAYHARHGTLDGFDEAVALVQEGPLSYFRPEEWSTCPECGHTFCKGECR